jgi:hypothetical protein
MTDENQKELAPAPPADSLAKKVEKSRSRSKNYTMDLRVHSPASLGYLAIEGIDSAPAIVRLAKVKGLDLIAVTDFYSGDFIDRVVTAARDSSLTIIPGVDLRCRVGSCDDVIISSLFPENTTTQRINDFLELLNVPTAMRGNKDYLVKMPIEEILFNVEAFAGLALPSHMDKTPHRMAAIPILVEKYGFRAFDLAYADSAAYFKRRWPKQKFQLFTFSNANALAQVGSRSARVKMSVPGFAGLRELVGRANEAPV